MQRSGERASRDQKQAAAGRVATEGSRSQLQAEYVPAGGAYVALHNTCPLTCLFNIFLNPTFIRTPNKAFKFLKGTILKVYDVRSAICS